MRLTLLNHPSGWTVYFAIVFKGFHVLQENWTVCFDPNLLSLRRIDFLG